MSVTHDLAIAKFALSIQSEESPKFEIIFIQLGSFHIELSFFKAVEKFIADSCVPYILPESSALAEGLMDAFLSGKHYSRCRKVHLIFAAALQSLHFEKFLNTMDPSFVEEFRGILEQLKPTNFSMKLPMEIEELFLQSFCQQTMNGDHGPTAKYWMTYIQLIELSSIELYHQFVRAI
jgi:hypothetical protein